MFKIETGKTSDGDWTDYDGGPWGITIKVDTTCAKFTSTPHYHVSLHGDGWHWRAAGVNAIYEESKNGFKVYLAWSDNEGAAATNGENPLRAAFAKKKHWYLKWTGIEGRGLCQ